MTGQKTGQTTHTESDKIKGRLDSLKSHLRCPRSHRRPGGPPSTSLYSSVAVGPFALSGGPRTVPPPSQSSCAPLSLPSERQNRRHHPHPHLPLRTGSDRETQSATEKRKRCSLNFQKLQTAYASFNMFPLYKESYLGDILPGFPRHPVTRKDT